MRKRAVILNLAVCFAAAAVCFAAPNPLMGKWKLNESKSKLSADGPKNHTVTYSPAGDSVKVTVDGTDKAGKATHNEWMGKFDGKDYPVTGDAMSDARSYKTIDANTLEITIKKGKKVAGKGRIVASPDGKTRTVTLNGTNAEGKKFNSTAVYDKK
jgi:hypothetical protein